MIGLRQNANFGKISAFLLLYSVLVKVVPVEGFQNIFEMRLAKK